MLSCYFYFARSKSIDLFFLNRELARSHLMDVRKTKKNCMQIEIMHDRYGENVHAF